MEKRPMDRETRARKRKAREAWKKTWHVLRPLLVLAIALCICYVLVSKVMGFVLDKFLYPVDSADATPITVTVQSGSGASAIAKLLYEAGGTDADGEPAAPGLIKSKAVFKVYVDFTGKSSKLRAGTYVLSRNMDIPQIVDIICAGNPPKSTVRFTVTEGMDVEAIADKLVSQGVLQDASEFLALCRSGEEFREYSFIDAIADQPAGAKRDYLLEGYLFPDTYEVYTDASAKTIVNKMLMQFLAVFSDEYIERAQALGMTTDDVIKLAALIEKEAKLESDFAKVSAVFHNRLRLDMALESDASLRYIFKLNILNFTEAQRQDPSLYNTIAHKGLGLGPITNPGRRAIEAALYPEETFEEEGEEYLFFTLKYGWNGELAYAKTNEEHERNVERYKQYWDTLEMPAGFTAAPEDAPEEEKGDN